MNTKKLKLVVLLVCVVMLSPFVTHAGNAVQLSDTSALFTINVTIEDNDFATAIPLTTKADATYEDRIDDVGYKIQKRISAEHNPIISTTGIVLAPNLPIVDGRYQVPKGTRHTFTVLILASFTNVITDDYQALITKFPYFIEDRRTTAHQNQLDLIAPAVLTID